MHYDLTSSIVLYKSERAELLNAAASILSTGLNTKLYLIDNSPTDQLKYELADIITDKRVDYRFLNRNVGYGAGHNIAMKDTVSNTKYHLVLNPDVTFDGRILEQIYRFMETHNDVGQLMPKIFYRTGEVQRLCKLLPTPFDLIIRRLLRGHDYAKYRAARYELHNFNYNTVLNVPNLSGCFMFIRAKVLDKVGFFDPRYFMYLEDVDLTRRIYHVAKTVFYPDVQIVHSFKRQSYHNVRLLKHHMVSAIRYFNKWGWLKDDERRVINRQVLSEIEELEPAKQYAPYVDTEYKTF